MKDLIYLSIILLSLYTISCKRMNNHEQTTHETILVDLNDAEEYSIRNSGNIISLELTDNSLLTYIEQIELIGDKIFIYDKQRVLVFNTNGNFLYSVGKIGHGPGEYTAVSSFFLDGNNICIYDGNLQTLFIYGINGEFISAKNTKESIASLYLVENKKYIGKKKFQGDYLKVPSLAFLDENLDIISDINNRFLVSGIGVYDYCSVYEGNILYQEFLNDTIFSVEKTKIVPKYYVDFGKLKIPSHERKNKSINEIIEYLNRSNSSVHATGVRYIQEDEYYVRFIFSFGEKIYYVKYNKTTNKAIINHYYDPEHILSTQYFMKYYDNNVILSLYDPDNVDDNPKLLFIDEFHFEN